MRALIVSSEAPPVVSGVARAIGEIATGLRDRGHAVEILSADDGRTLRWDRLRVSTATAKLHRIIHASGPFDVINVHGPAPTVSDLALMQLLLRRHRHPPVVYTHHFALHFGIRGVDAAARAYDCVMRRFAARAHAVVTTTSSYRELFPSANGDVHTVPWGIEQNAFAPGPDDRFDGTRPLRVLAVGQLRRYKGMMIAVRAVAGVPGITLTVAGDGPLLGEIEYQIGVADAANVTLCRGPSNAELHDLYREHDVIVLPSRTRAEAFGIVLLEGMASGCVPVASDLPGVRDVIADIGLTATPGSPASLRARLLQLAVNPAEVERRRHLAIEHAARFSWKSTVDAYEGLFLDVVAKSATVSR